MSQDMSRSEAMRIHQDLLDRTGAALINGHFQDFLECFALPHQLDTFQGKRVLSTAEEFQEVFEAMRLKNRRSGIDQLVRNCIEAEFKGPDIVEATHESRALAGNELKEGPYPCFSILRRVDGYWRVASSAYAVDGQGHVGRALMGRAEARA